jgi:hypothetical protein
LKKDKSPSPNDWTIESFIGLYDLLENDLMRVLEEVRSSGKVSRDFNSTFLALIPNKDMFVVEPDYLPDSEVLAFSRVYTP